MILETVLFYSLCVQLGSTIGLALIGHFFPSIWESKTSLRVLLPSNNDTCINSCILSYWEKEIPLNEISPKYIALAKACSKSLL